MKTNVRQGSPPLFTNPASPRRWPRTAAAAGLHRGDSASARRLSATAATVRFSGPGQISCPARLRWIPLYIALRRRASGREDTGKVRIMKHAENDVIRAMPGQTRECPTCDFKHPGESPCRVFPESAYEIVRNWRTGNRGKVRLADAAAVRGSSDWS